MSHGLCLCKVWNDSNLLPIRVFLNMDIKSSTWSLLMGTLRHQHLQWDWCIALPIAWRIPSIVFSLLPSHKLRCRRGNPMTFRAVGFWTFPMANGTSQATNELLCSDQSLAAVVDLEGKPRSEMGVFKFRGLELSVFFGSSFLNLSYQKTSHKCAEKYRKTEALRDEALPALPNHPSFFSQTRSLSGAVQHCPHQQIPSPGEQSAGFDCWKPGPNQETQQSLKKNFSCTAFNSAFFSLRILMTCAQSSFDWPYYGRSWTIRFHRAGFWTQLPSHDPC